MLEGADYVVIYCPHRPAQVRSVMDCHGFEESVDEEGLIEVRGPDGLVDASIDLVAPNTPAGHAVLGGANAIRRSARDEVIAKRLVHAVAKSAVLVNMSFDPVLRATDPRARMMLDLAVALDGVVFDGHAFLDRDGADLVVVM
jgi:hypothetical protein